PPPWQKKGPRPAWPPVGREVNTGKGWNRGGVLFRTRGRRWRRRKRQVGKREM
ncbi:unnamed protein product, partial [Rangifer tarandus platyrhynchus]